ncbi:MAG TPA: hypothetical protein VNS58_22980 [Puia sp.]|nr:hypothetical protein [Puia sp.]
MFLKRTILAPIVVLSLAGCGRQDASSRDLELLTGTPWKYEKAGFDSDDDGIFDALDPRIAGGDKDNTIIFKTDGTGALVESKIKGKATEPRSLPFMWSFQNNDSTIYFEDQYYKVRALTNQRLEMYADQKLGGINTRYIIVLKH